MTTLTTINIHNVEKAKKITKQFASKKLNHSIYEKFSKILNRFYNYQIDSS
jgi:hypothetical protein